MKFSVFIFVALVLVAFHSSAQNSPKYEKAIAKRNWRYGYIKTIDSVKTKGIVNSKKMFFMDKTGNTRKIKSNELLGYSDGLYEYESNGERFLKFIKGVEK